MADWIKEGCAERSATAIAPVRHLLVDDNGNWSLWCGGSKGLPQTPVLGNERFCGKCLALANESIADGTLASDSIQGWPVEETA